MNEDERLIHYLNRRGRISWEGMEQALREYRTVSRPLPEYLAGKFGVTPEQLEDALAAVRARLPHCPRCAAAIHAPTVRDGRELCPWCQGAVELRDVTAESQGPDFESIAELTREELPPEVRVIRTVPGRRFGKYILLSEVGRGGSGVVQKAWDVVLGEYVALKVVRESDAAGLAGGEGEEIRREMVLGLLQEARVALRLQHDHIVQIRDIGLVGRQLYIAMDFVEGNTLGQRLRRSREEGRLSCLYEDPPLYLGMFRDVCDAMHYAHTFSRPLVHCDLKPGNIMIGHSGLAYVLDFGLARLLDMPSADDTALRGTPGYMAPEQVAGRNQAIGVWTDVYGLGAILFELLAGRPVFTGGTLMDVSLQTMNDLPIRPSSLIQGSTEVNRPGRTQLLAMATMLETICLKCLAKEPGERYGSALEVEEEIEGVLEAIDMGEFEPYLKPGLRP